MKLALSFLAIAFFIISCGKRKIENMRSSSSEAMVDSNSEELVEGESDDLKAIPINEAEGGENASTPENVPVVQAAADAAAGSASGPPDPTEMLGAVLDAIDPALDASDATTEAADVLIQNEVQVFQAVTTKVQLRNSYNDADFCLAALGAVAVNNSPKMQDCIGDKAVWMRKTQENGSILLYQVRNGVDYCLSINLAEQDPFTLVTYQVCGSTTLSQEYFVTIVNSRRPPYVRTLSIDPQRKFCLDVFADTLYTHAIDCAARPTFGSIWTLTEVE